MISNNCERLDLVFTVWQPNLFTVEYDNWLAKQGYACFNLLVLCGEILSITLKFWEE
jgi:hypothetical protein